MKNKIFIVTGSKSDQVCMEEGLRNLQKVGASFRVEVLSAHRHTEKLRKVCMDLENNDTQVVIACAGMAAALPGFVASYVNIPVLGVAMKGGLLDGLDAVMSIVSIPRGVAVGCTGVGKAGFVNACIMALQIVAAKDRAYLKKTRDFKKLYNK